MTSRIVGLIPILPLLMTQMAHAIPATVTVITDFTSVIQSGSSTNSNSDSSATESSASESISDASTSTESSTFTGSSDPQSTQNSYGQCTSAGATSTISAPSATGSSAPLAGQDLQPKCSHLWANNPDEDWLYATLCALTANSTWLLDTIEYIYGFEDPQNLPVANFTFFSGNLSTNKTFSVTYGGAKDNGNSDPNKAWYGGGHRIALLSSDEQDLLANGVFKSKDDTWFRLYAGHYALMHLIGKRAIPEDPPIMQDISWNAWTQHPSETPVTILTKANASCIAKDRYFSLTQFDETSSEVTLWDPTAGGQEGYFKMNIDHLRQDSLRLFHVA